MPIDQAQLIFELLAQPLSPEERLSARRALEVAIDDNGARRRIRSNDRPDAKAPDRAYRTNVFVAPYPCSDARSFRLPPASCGPPTYAPPVVLPLYLGFAVCGK